MMVSPIDIAISNPYRILFLMLATLSSLYNYLHIYILPLLKLYLITYHGLAIFVDKVGPFKHIGFISSIYKK
ncbi:hypothetical protein M2263_003404 [Providencia alcalifaciens]|nr:hypothetical protein [Providencia alcalifaciens]